MGITITPGVVIGNGFTLGSGPPPFLDMIYLVVGGGGSGGTYLGAGGGAGGYRTNYASTPIVLDK
jgi:hypothetical protein